MAGRQKIGEKFSIVLTPDLAALVEEVQQATGEETSPLLRKALRVGLPLVKSGGAADVLTLDSELSKEVDAELKRANETRDFLKEPHRTRASMLIEAIRHGIKAVGIYEMIKEAKAKEGLEDAMAQAILAHSDLTVYPEKRAAKVAMIERALYWEQVWDLVIHVPEARERKEAIEKLITMRIAANEWAKVWGCGLSTTEIQWQAAMHEKYGAGPVPKEEIEKREREREAGTDKGRNTHVLPDVAAIPKALVEALENAEGRERLLAEARQRLAQKPELPPATPTDGAPSQLAPSAAEKPSKPSKKKPGK